MTNALLKLGKAETIYARADSIVTNRQDKQQISIINVDALRKLSDEASDTLVEVFVPTLGGDSVKEKIVSLRNAELAALTAEVILKIKNPKQNIIKKMDLLDFPGYRGRLSLHKGDSCNIDGKWNSSDWFLRGKVAYLFERYTDEYYINCLIMCTAADRQIEAKISKVITNWINSTQGDINQRSQHKAGLIWAITKFDKRIEQFINSKGNINNLQLGKNGLLHQVLLEKFSDQDWLEQWSTNGAVKLPFNNIFLVRKPCLESTCFIESNQAGCEVALLEKYKEYIAKFKLAFEEDETVRKYVHNPKEAIDAVFGLNDGGMQHICDYIDTIDADNIRMLAVKNVLINQCNKGASALGKWYVSDDTSQEYAKKKVAVNQLGYQFKSLPRFSECFNAVLSIFNLADSEIKGLVNTIDLNIDDSKSTDSSKSLETNHIASQVDDDFDFDFDNLTVDDLGKNNVEHVSEETLGDKLFNAWIEHMRDTATHCDTILEKYLTDIPKPILMFMADELVNYAIRSDLKQKLNTLVNDVDKISTSKGASTSMLITAVKLYISDFLYSFDHTLFADASSESDIVDIQLPEEQRPSSGKQNALSWIQHFAKEEVLKHVESHNDLPVAENAKLGNFIHEYKRLQGL